MHSIRQRIELQPPRFCFASFFFLSGARPLSEFLLPHRPCCREAVDDPERPIAVRLRCSAACVALVSPFATVHSTIAWPKSWVNWLSDIWYLRSHNSGRPPV